MFEGENNKSILSVLKREKGFLKSERGKCCLGVLEINGWRFWCFWHLQHGWHLIGTFWIAFISIWTLFECYQLKVNGLIYAYTVNKLEFILKHGFTTTLWSYNLILSYNGILLSNV